MVDGSECSAPPDLLYFPFFNETVDESSPNFEAKTSQHDLVLYFSMHV